MCSDAMVTIIIVNCEKVAVRFFRTVLRLTFMPEKSQPQGFHNMDHAKIT
jgi:hypothetical protein